jgi:hypothetical protein
MKSVENECEKDEMKMQPLHCCCLVVRIQQQIDRNNGERWKLRFLRMNLPPDTVPSS